MLEFSIWYGGSPYRINKNHV